MFKPGYKPNPPFNVKPFGYRCDVCGNDVGFLHVRTDPNRDIGIIIPSSKYWHHENGMVFCSSVCSNSIYSKDIQHDWAKS
jgi:hypothetical protein